MFIPDLRNQGGRSVYRFSSKSLASVSVLHGLFWVVLFDTGIGALVSTVLNGRFLDSLLISQFFVCQFMRALCSSTGFRRSG